MMYGFFLQENSVNKNDLLALLQPEIEKIESTMRNEISAVGNPLLQEIVKYALFNGGKRIRPVLTIMAARLTAFSNMPEGLAAEDELQPPDDLYQLATVFEFLHGASLLHDDVIDHAEQRRGKPSANSVWSNSHVILAGDYLHTRAMTMAGTIGGEHILAIIGNATGAMIGSEFLQMQTAQQLNLSEENYFAVLHGKTGSLISAACEVGTFFSESSEEQQQALRTYGDALGLAFQVVDDLLDYLGDAKETGKTVGNDFIEGKLTLPLIHALDNCKQEDREKIMALLQDSNEKRADNIDQARDFIETHGGFTYARQGAETLIMAATDALAVFSDCQARKTLQGLAQYVLTRKK